MKVELKVKYDLSCRAKTALEKGQLEQLFRQFTALLQANKFAPAFVFEEEPNEDPRDPS
jgi:hypothetical protein